MKSDSSADNEAVAQPGAAEGARGGGRDTGQDFLKCTAVLFVLGFLFTVERNSRGSGPHKFIDSF